MLPHNADVEDGMIHLYQVDAFTDQPFRGNPAGVCIVEAPKAPDWMTRVAAEMNLSETAFLCKGGDGYTLRWFTPETEVSLCGHATLASAHILWQEQFVRHDADISFTTMSGVLTARKKGSSIRLDFPARSVEPAESNRALNEALGADPVFTGSYLTPKGRLYLLELRTEALVRELKPDFRSLARSGARAVIVTAISSAASQDFVSRYFAPVVGIDEDPVTGSAHCCLAPYWAAKLGKTELTGFQASQRSGYVRCIHAGDRVSIEGSAVTIFRAELLV
jgi:PhzF family phenazine biosynthesis protein